MRAFLALTPPDDLRQHLSRLQDDLRCGRHVDDDDLHLTLAFFGDARETELEELDLDLDMVRTGPVPLEVKGVDVFGSAHPRLAYAPIAAHPTLVHLQRKLATAARRAGIALPHTRFVPHITLARFAHRMPPEDHVRLGRFLQRHGNTSFAPVWVDRLTLFRSTLHEDGPRYDVLEEYALA